MEILAGTDMIEAGSQAILFNKDVGLTEKGTELFEELMLFQKKVFLICLGFSRNASDAQDLAQEVYLRAYRNIGTLGEPSLAKVWLFKIARNTCLNFQKKHRLDRISSYEILQKSRDPLNPESKMIHREQLLILKRAVHKLPKKQKDVFVLKEYGELSYQEIARTLNIELGTVMSRLNRARQAIIKRISGDENV